MKKILGLLVLSILVAGCESAPEPTSSAAPKAVVAEPRLMTPEQLAWNVRVAGAREDFRKDIAAIRKGDFHHDNFLTDTTAWMVKHYPDDSFAYRMEVLDLVSCVNVETSVILTTGPFYSGPTPDIDREVKNCETEGEANPEN